MKIINKTRNTVLAENVGVADTAFKRMKGLLGRRGLSQGGGLILKPGNSIHTLFMQFPIDALFVDNENRVIKALCSIKPFRFTPIYFRAALIIELPENSVKSSLTQEGDVLILE